MGSKRIYLSPSNQPANAYAVGNTNEKVQMEDLAKRIKTILDSEYECETVTATLSMGIGYNERAKEAKDKGCEVYIAIHSNAGGAGKASGAVAFYHPNQLLGKTLAASIVKELNAICPIKSNRTSAVQSGMAPFNGQGYAEIRNPYNRGLIAVLAETDFHDHPQLAQWIISNKDAIAKAYVAAIVSALGIAKKKSEAPAGKKLYKVQVGAYSIKVNAEVQLARLKAAGFDGFIKYE